MQLGTKLYMFCINSTNTYVHTYVVTYLYFLYLQKLYLLTMLFNPRIEQVDSLLSKSQAIIS